MKKKIYFITSAVIQIILAIILILNANSIMQAVLEEMTEVYAAFPASFQERVMNVYENSGLAMLVIPAILSIIFNLITINIAIHNTILRNKGKIITFSAMGIFLNNYLLGIALSIANLIIILCLKRKNPEDFPIKRQIPKVEEVEPTKSEKIFGIALIVLYIMFMVTNFINLEKIPPIALMIIAILFYVLLAVFAILAFKTRLKRDIKLLKENFTAYMTYILPRIGITLPIFLITNLICLFVTRSAVSENQATIESLPMLVLIPMAVIWAPIVEELLFRGITRRYIKNNVLFIIVSAVLFGLIHTIIEPTLFDIIVKAIPYALLGGSFAYIYSKSNNITTNMLSHLMWNAFSVLMTSLVAFAIL